MTIDERIPTMSSAATASPPASRDDLVPPGSWRVREESEIGFAVKGLGRTVKGRFGSFDASVVHAPGDGVMASGSVEVASIDTGIAKRDKHLRSADFFDAANYPQITFGSRRIVADGDRYDVPGTLTIKGVSQDVSLIGRRLPPAPGDGGETVRIAAEATINRHDFGVKAPQRVELFGLAVGAHVKITLRVVAVSDDRSAID
jgi:polyisoprenoid-binding protein YceI